MYSSASVIQEESRGRAAGSRRDALLELVWPTRCAGCEKLGALVCKTCREELKSIQTHDACSKCGAPFGRLICTECYSDKGKEHFSFSLAVSALEMDKLIGRVIVCYKDNNEHRLAEFLSESLAHAIPPSWLYWADALTWIPGSKKTIRQRGFDHMQRIASELMTRTGLPAQLLLQKRRTKDQRQLGREERQKNLKQSFALLESACPHKNILLIDDVFTTGATLEAAAKTLLEGGAKEVRVASIAGPW